MRKAADLPIIPSKWPENGKTYDCLVAIPFEGDGVVIAGPKEIRSWCEALGQSGLAFMCDLDMEEIPDLEFPREGVYRARMTYWQSCDLESDEDFEGGFGLSIVEKLRLP